MRRTARTLIIFLLGILIGASTMYGCFAVNSPLGAQGNPPNSPPPQTTGQGAGQPVAPRPSSPETDAVIEVYERVSPSVVNITFTGRTRDPFGRVQQQEGTGSGFIIDQQGHIVTNQHVVENSTRLDVTLADETSYTAEVVAIDDANDLALIRLNAPVEKLQTLTIAQLGDSSQLRVGQPVVAIGNPFGLERSASAGIVSSVGRTRPGTTQRLITDMIQTDAAINPGNSGGPLLNLRGEVIGINEQIEAPGRGNIGIGFAIPVNTLKRYLPDLMAGRPPRHAWIGISGVPVTPSIAEQLGLRQAQGVLLANVVRNGPAAQAGLRGGGNNVTAADILTDIDGKPVRSVEDVASAIDRRNPGEVVKVGYLRGGQAASIDVTLGVWEESGTPAR
jgi:S1-C subfamily serine protease